jgi:hypothetical protein
VPRPGGERAGHANAELDGHEQAHEGVHVRVLEAALAMLSAQLAIANERAESADRRAGRADERIDQLLTELVDARAAERISADAAAALRHELDLLRAIRPWWRRWFR